MIQTAFQLLYSFVPAGRDGNDFSIRESLPERSEMVGCLRQIHLVRHHPPRSQRKPRVIEIDFAPQMLQIFDRVAPLAPGHVDHEKEQLAASDVP